MSKTIEVYVRNEIASEVYRSLCQVDPFRPASKLQFIKIRKLPQIDQEALDVVLDVAKKKGWKVKSV